MFLFLKKCHSASHHSVQRKRAGLNLSMEKIKCTKKTNHVRQAGEDYQDMEYLVTAATNVKFSWILSFRNLKFVNMLPSHDPQEGLNSKCISGGTCKIETCHQTHPTKTHSTILNFPAMQDQAVNDEYQRREAKTCVHNCSIWSEIWPTKLGIDSGVQTSDSKYSNLCEICMLALVCSVLSNS